MDPLAVFFTQTIDVKRLTGHGATGDQHAAAVAIQCRLKYENRLVRDAAGEEVVARSRASMSADTPTIPAGSLVRPARETVWRRVISEARHVGGFDHSPDYYSIEIA